MGLLLWLKIFADKTVLPSERERVTKLKMAKSCHLFIECVLCDKHLQQHDGSYHYFTDEKREAEGV